MGRILALTTLLLTLSLAAIAASAPELVVDRPVFEFGTITQGEKVDHSFVLKNRGSAPLTIKNTKTSCGCTVASVSSSVIPPGKNTAIKASFDSNNFFGPVTKTISVETNDPKNPVFVLTLRGTVVEEIVVAPRQVNLGTLKTGTVKEVFITIENKGSTQLKLTDVKSSLPQVTIRVARNVVNPGNAGTIIVNATTRDEDRMLSGYLTIKTNNPTKPLITIPVFGSVVK